jgi:hypothetical protein
MSYHELGFYEHEEINRTISCSHWVCNPAVEGLGLQTQAEQGVAIEKKIVISS